jgi:hypothetical protein
MERHERIHEGQRFGALGDFAELLVDKTKLEMYVCPSCLGVEFFVSELNDYLNLR